MPLMKKLIIAALLVALILFAANASRLRMFGRVMDSREIGIGSVPHRVVLRERCVSDLVHVILLDRILRDRLSEYEYWTELRRDGQLVAVSDRYHWDSTAYDHPRIDSADSAGATVSLHPSQPSVCRFEWLSEPR
jgi:hypothetical protein